jgi:membrane-bound lytic murein transglycosylase D
MIRLICLLLLIKSQLAFASSGLVGAQYSVTKSDIDIKIAKKWFDHYYSKGKDDFHQAFVRGDKYRKTIQLVLSRYQIPFDFYYLAMTESYFNNHARSNKKAVGLWQFIPSTAKAYGLLINNQIDERRHPVKSTIAAAKYIKDLYNIFQDWTLAAAAYNCGEYRVLRAIKKGGTRSFAQLAKKKLLPSETINYVSKFWVTREIDNKIRNTEYNSSADLYSHSSPVFIRENGASIKTLALIAEISLELLIKYNPDISSDLRTLPGNFTIYVPRDNAEIYSSFVRQKGVISKVKKPESLKLLGVKNSRKGDDIKITFLSNQQLKIKNIRTKEEVVINKKDLSRI